MVSLSDISIFSADPKEKVVNPEYQTFGDFYGHFIFALFYDVELVQNNNHCNCCHNNDIPDAFCCYLRLFASDGTSISIETVQTTPISTLSSKNNNSNSPVRLSYPNIKSDNLNKNNNNNHDDSNQRDLTPQMYIPFSRSNHDEKKSDYGAGRGHKHGYVAQSNGYHTSQAQHNGRYHQTMTEASSMMSPPHTQTQVYSVQCVHQKQQHQQRITEEELQGQTQIGQGGVQIGDLNICNYQKKHKMELPLQGLNNLNLGTNNGLLMYHQV